MTIKTDIIKAAIEACKKDNINFTGFGIARAIYIDKALLKPSYGRKTVDKSPGFNWGYSGPGPSQLAGALLLKHISPKIGLVRQKEVVHALMPVFELTFIATLKQNNFTATIKFKHWLDRLYAESQGKQLDPVKLTDLIKVSDNLYIEEVKLKAGLKMPKNEY